MHKTREITEKPCHPLGLKGRVTCEQFVAAVAAQGYGNLLTGEAAEQICRYQGRIGKRLIQFFVDAIEQVEEGSMPPRQYTVIHRDATLSAEERRILIDAFAQMSSDDSSGRGRGRGGDDDRDDD